MRIAITVAIAACSSRSGVIDMYLYLRLAWALPLGWCLLAYSPNLSAAPLEQGRLTQIVKDVHVLKGSTLQARPSNGMLPAGDWSIQSGADSRAEIKFAESAVARLGDKSALALAENRTFDLLSGAALTQIRKGVGGTSVKAADISATATGTTLLAEHYPGAYIKFIVIDGTSRICLTKKGHARDCILLRAGQMLIAKPTATGLPEPVDVDLERLLKTCHLLTDFLPLPRQDLVVKASQNQRRLRSRGDYVGTDLVIFGRGTVVNMTRPNSPAKNPDRLAVSPAPDTPATNPP